VLHLRVTSVPCSVPALCQPGHELRLASHRIA
jgi:hypothetical protein